MGMPGYIPINGESVIRIGVEVIPCPDCGGSLMSNCCEDAGINLAEGGILTSSSS